MTRVVTYTISIAAGLIAAALVLSVSIPQLLMIAARPIYQALFGITDPYVWIANIVWTPVSGIPLTAATRLGIPNGPLTMGPFVIWGLLIVPLTAGAFVGRGIFSLILPDARNPRRGRHLALLILFAVSILLNFPIPVSSLMTTVLGFSWTTM